MIMGFLYFPSILSCVSVACCFQLLNRLCQNASITDANVGLLNQLYASLGNC